MTNEEALAHFKNHEYMTDFSWQDEMSEVAIKAIEKQIPKKPVGRHKKCPTCEMIEFGYEEVNYCEWCGQKLDFGKEKKHDA